MKLEGIHFDQILIMLEKLSLGGSFEVIFAGLHDKLVVQREVCIPTQGLL